MCGSGGSASMAPHPGERQLIWCSNKLLCRLFVNQPCGGGPGSQCDPLAQNCVVSVDPMVLTSPVGRGLALSLAARSRREIVYTFLCDELRRSPVSVRE